jgi:hypothetical protein
VRVQALDHTLDLLHEREEIFHGFRILGPMQRQKGGQGVVQFAQEASGGRQDVAIKFFTHRATFEVERALYNDSRLRGMMAAVKQVEPNDAPQPLMMAPGYPFPPFIVVEVRTLLCRENLVVFSISRPGGVPGVVI